MRILDVSGGLAETIRATAATRSTTVLFLTLLAWSVAGEAIAQVVRLPAVEPSRNAESIAPSYPQSAIPAATDSELPRILHNATPQPAVAGLQSTAGVYDPLVVPPADQGPPGRLVSHPDSSSEILQTPGQNDVAVEAEPKLPPGARNGFFQKVLFDGTWLAPGGDNGMGIYDLHLQGIFALPCPKPTSPLVLTPNFTVHYLDGPQGANLPPQLYDATLQFRWLSQVTPTLGLDLAVTPGVFSDFDQGSNKAFRIPAHAATAWTWNDTTKVVLGAAYLDRPDIEVIPVGGVIWKPRDDWKLDLLFPTPKIAHRVAWGGNLGDDVQDWIYLAGEFTGDAWAIAAAKGGTDQVVLSDYRAIVGIERKIINGVSSRFEVGYVFRRRIRYASDTPDLWPNSTVMLRGGLSY